MIEAEYIKGFKAREEWVPDVYKSVPHVIITCDPNTTASEKGSEMALIAIAPILAERVVKYFSFFFFYFMCTMEVPK